MSRGHPRTPPAPDSIHLGFELGTGAPVEVPVRHMVITGQTQEAGKTTTLEALIARSGLRAVTFITKRGEGSFTGARRIGPYFQEQANWQFVASILEASRGEKMRFERAWIIRASKGANTLADVHRNVQLAMKTAKGMNADMYLCLDAYLEAVVPQISTVKWATTVDLQPGVNAMDLRHLNVEMQHLVIKSTIDWVLANEDGTVVVVPEAWKFIPQGRGTPVKLAAEAYIRQAAGLRNYLWLDSQDIAGVDKLILKSVPLWALGVQRESNEIKRTLDQIPAGMKKPRADQIATQGLGQFFVCWGTHIIPTYVQPLWMTADEARAVALGQAVPSAPPPRPVGQGRSPHHEAPPAPPKEDPAMCEQHVRAEKDLATCREEIATLKGELRTKTTSLEQADLRAARAARAGDAVEQLGAALARILPPGAGAPAAVDEDALVQRVLARIPAGGSRVLQVIPLEKLRADFQQMEVDRLLEAIRGLNPVQKRVLTLLETTDGAFVSQPNLATRLGRSTAGGSMADFGRMNKELAAMSLIEMVERQGARKRLRAKIAEDLAFYKATETDIDATYQTVMYTLATGAEG